MAGVSAEGDEMMLKKSELKERGIELKYGVEDGMPDDKAEVIVHGVKIKIHAHKRIDGKPMLTVACLKVKK